VSVPDEHQPCITYLITSYQSPEQLCRLVGALKRGDPSSSIVIEHDSIRSPLDPSVFRAFSGVHVLIVGKPVVWGGISQESSRWRAFRWILEHLETDWVMVLSGQDYPIAPLPRFRERLQRTTADAIIHGEQVTAMPEGQLRDECRSRYLLQYRQLPSFGLERRIPARWRSPLARLRRVIFSKLNSLQPWFLVYSTPAELGFASRVGREPRLPYFSDDFPCWYHDSWYALSRRAVEHVVTYLDNHPDFVAYYARTVIPVESATGTIVFNDPVLTVEDDRLHAIRWSDPISGHPDLLTIDDLPFLRTSSASFARKFAGDSDALFLELDSAIF
jgi:hypothetical protein